MHFTPGDDGANRFRRIPFAVGLRGERPSRFWNAFERGLHVPLIVGEANFSDNVAGRLLSTTQYPKPNIDQWPM